MPFDVENVPAIGVGGVPANTAMLRFLMFNRLIGDPAIRIPTLASGNPNPLTLAKGSQISRLWHPNRRRRCRLTGGYIVSSETGKGYEQAPNWQLTADATTVDCRRSGSTDIYSVNGGALLEREMEAKLKASGHANAATFTVVYDGWHRFDGTNLPTFKWTIANTVVFAMTSKSGDPNSILPSLGFTAASYSGATSYTSENPSIHTEAWVIWYSQGTAGGAGYAEARNRWLVMVDFNVTASGDVKFYASQAEASGPGIDDIPDGSYVADETLYDLGTQFGTYEWIDGNGLQQGRITRGANGDLGGAANMWAVDLRTWCETEGGTVANLDAAEWFKLRVVDPTNLAGYISLGYLYQGVGWHPDYNARFDAAWTRESRTKVDQTDRGDFRQRFRPAGWRGEMRFRFMSEADYAILNGKQAMRRDEPAGAGVARRDSVYDVGAIESTNPVIVLNPDFDLPTAYGTATDYEKFVSLGIFGRAEYGRFRRARTVPTTWDLDRLIVREEPP